MQVAKRTKGDGPFLESIQIINFMSHKNLLVEFRKRVSCITGGNGSGKSGIMIAIGVLFGVRAYSMERAGTVKELVRSGESSAVIRGVLRNREYRVEEIGETIEIERTVSADGGTRIKISGKGGVVGRTQEELRSLMEHFRLNLNNPLSFLTQDSSKKMLRISAPRSIYRFFKMGTDIEEVEALHQRAIEKLGEAMREIENAEEEEKGLSESIKRAEDILNLSRSAEEIGGQLKSLGMDLRWARVSEKEREKREIEVSLERMYKEFEGLSGQIEKRKAEHSEVVEKMSREKGSEMERKSRRREAEQERKKEVESENRRKGEIEREFEYFGERIKTYEESIKRIESILEKAGGGGEVERMKEAVEREREGIRAEEEELVRKKGEISREGMERAEKRSLLLERQKELRGRAKRYDEMLGASGARGPAQFFGSRLARVLAAIDSRKIEAIGPVGLKIKVSNPKWSRAVEAALGSTLFGFVVRDRRSRDSLLEVFKNCDVHYPIYFSSKSSSESLLSKIRPSPSETKTLLSQISSESTLILEQLVILAGIERVLLVDRRDDAYVLLRRYSGEFDVAYTKEADKIRYIEGKLSDMRCKLSDTSLFAITKEKMEEMARQKKEIERSVEEIDGEIRRDETEAKERRRKLEEEEREVGRRRGEMEKSVSMLAETSGEDVVEELSRSRKNLMSVCEQVRSMVLCLEESKRKIHLLESREMERAEERSRDLEGIESVLREELSRKEKELGEMGVQIERYLSSLEEVSLECSRRREDALLHCNGEIRIAERAPIQIERDMKSVEARMDVLRERAGEIEGIVEKREQMSRKRERIERIIRENKERVREMEKGLEERVEKRNVLRNEMASKCIANFAGLLTKRDYDGCLRFDHGKEELYVEVKIDGGGGNKNSLSGGERSFASTCLLLSLWPCIPSPLRILDEFDVYMDGLNRKAAVNLVVKSALASASQVIIITPLGMGDIPENACQIIRLRSPQK
jgi:structural maintenance of chromosomes protein 6